MLLKYEKNFLIEKRKALTIFNYKPIVLDKTATNFLNIALNLN